MAAAEERELVLNHGAAVSAAASPRKLRCLDRYRVLSVQVATHRAAAFSGSGQD
jgi:hypothetical protein